METTIVNHKNKHLTVLLSLSIAFGIFAMFCFVLHLSPKQMAESLSDFAKHHYFLFGFISLSIAVIILKIYLDRTAITRSRGGSYPAQILQRTRRRKLKVMYQNIKRSIDHQAAEPQSTYTAKEALLQVKLKAAEALANEEERKMRWNDLQTALSLGNLYKQKVIICFYDGATRKHTLATIWHVDPEMVSLKGGALIPVKNIYRVEL